MAAAGALLAGCVPVPAHAVAKAALPINVRHASRKTGQ
jgi:hypothetical protein